MPDRGHEGVLVAEEVAELAPDRRGHRRGQDVGGDHPGQVVEAAELADDRGQRGATIMLSSLASSMANISPLIAVKI